MLSSGKGAKLCTAVNPISSPSLIAGDVSNNPEEHLNNFLIFTPHLYSN